MSTYTTGELAKLCGISVRTVQFYDTKGILHPSETTEGGRRIYSEADRKQMQLICLFKSLGLSLDSIKGILHSTHPAKVVELLLEEQEKQLFKEEENILKQREAISAVRQCLHNVQALPENLNHDIEEIMKENNRKKLRKTHGIMLFWGCLCTLLEITAVLIWILKGLWQPFAVIMPVVIVICTLLTRLYYQNTVYICSECNAAFRPSLREFFFSGHTPKTRKLTCTHCGKQCWCVEAARQA